jgi:aerobic-type carbon monoxide dehydrogenase small subunit (CoxS/CutS family)/carbon monoxide dehydrogenase subunit G
VTTGQRAVKVGADELAEVRFTVNGSPVSVTVPTRMHLADALRNRLGLTGTHLGCEHGVCGMCTVLLDGNAARACLILAVQAEGADIVTVEGLGTADEQHPLQRAFSHHHALQCGFCTPGFLLSAYDLLARGGVEPDTLPEELSGVLCRCTGYRGILAAVADLAQAYPDGIPPPGNCTARTILGRGGAGGGSVAGNSSSPTSPGPDAEAGRALEALQRPTGTPTMTVTVARELGSAIEDVWAVLNDVDRVARCLPGAQLTADLGADTYRGRVAVGLGPIRLAFDGLARITVRDVGDHRLELLARGADTGGNSSTAEIVLRAESIAAGGTELRVDARVFLSGRIAQFGRALAGDVGQRLFEQFADALDETARTGSVPAPTAAPGPLAIGAGAARAAFHRRIATLRHAVRRWLRR